MKPPVTMDVSRQELVAVKARLREILFEASTEKTRQVTPSDTTTIQHGEAKSEAKKARPGRGRRGAEEFVGARKVEVARSTLKPADVCPECQKGKVYAQKEPQVLVRVLEQAPLAAMVYRLQKLRCNPCREVFTEEAPLEAETGKYNATASGMLALLKYGSGLPFYRLENLQASLEIPLPASTQWEVLHNDDAPMPVLGREREARDPPERKGVFTSGIVARKVGHCLGHSRRRFV